MILTWPNNRRVDMQHKGGLWLKHGKYDKIVGGCKYYKGTQQTNSSKCDYIIK